MDDVIERQAVDSVVIELGGDEVRLILKCVSADNASIWYGKMLDQLRKGELIFRYRAALPTEEKG